jgi:acyl carrier protein
VLTEHVHATALQVLGLPATFPLDVHQGLRDAGLDSLMALELRNQLQSASGLRLSSTFAFDYPTVDAMARALADLLRVTPAGGPIGAAPAGAGPRRTDAEAAIGRISDAEAEALLRAELEAMAGGEPL